MQLSIQLSILQGTTSYFDGNMGRVGVKSDTVIWYGYFYNVWKTLFFESFAKFQTIKNKSFDYLEQ